MPGIINAKAPVTVIPHFYNQFLHTLMRSYLHLQIKMAIYLLTRWNKFLMHNSINSKETNQHGFDIGSNLLHLFQHWIKPVTPYFDSGSNLPHLILIVDQTCHTLFQQWITPATPYFNNRSHLPHLILTMDRTCHTLFRQWIKPATPCLIVNFALSISLMFVSFSGQNDCPKIHTRLLDLVLHPAHGERLVNVFIPGN